MAFIVTFFMFLLLVFSLLFKRPAPVRNSTPKENKCADEGKTDLLILTQKEKHYFHFCFQQIYF